METKRRLEASMIGIDAHFLINFFKSLVPDIEKYSILWFPIIPYIAMIVWESNKYFEKEDPNIRNQLDANLLEQIHKTRHMIKIFNEFDLFSAQISRLADYQFDMMNHKHVGLSSWKRTFQCDQGIYFLDGRVISNTTSGLSMLGNIDFREKFPNIDDAHREVGKYGREFSEFASSYLSIVVQAFPDIQVDLDVKPDAISKTTHKDFKATKKLRQIYNGPHSDWQLNAILLQIHININTIRYFIGSYFETNPVPLFKLKYVYFYHVAKSLERIQHIYWPKDELSTASKEILRMITSDDGFRELTFSRQFRNTLVHYGIDDIAVNSLQEDKPLWGLVEYYFNGKPIEEVAGLLENQIVKISTAMNIWFEQKY